MTEAAAATSPVAVRLSGEPGGRGDFTVPSRTVTGHGWTVIWIGGGSHWCSCPAFARRQRCAHADAVALAVEVEARALVAQSTPESRAAAELRLRVLEEIFDR